MADPRWLEVSFVVDGELAEALSEVLGRFVQGGVAVETDVKFTNPEDEGTAYGPVRVYGYLPIDDEIENTRHKLEESVWYLSRIKALPQPVYTPIEDQDWMNSWKQHYHPIKIGNRLMIVPAWMNPDTEKRIPLRIDPSMAFGTGTHPTTQLCLEMLEKYPAPGCNVIDVGCGSGILSIGAIKLGAKFALGVDIDPLSVKSTMENAKLNMVDQDIQVELGSVQELVENKYGLKSAPLVVANILAPVIIRLFDVGLADLVESGGIIILSGILDHQAQDVINAGSAHGLAHLDTMQINDWVALVLKAN